MLDETRAIGALAMLATLMFLVSVAPGMRHRRAARLAAIAVYAAVAAGVAIWSALWLFGVRF
ncbi:MAG: hypothetical protein JO032_10815 [Alphaproteobacteria bacterium]|nr:hypothetical protein [Alphaproteobacteria bacterium]